MQKNAVLDQRKISDGSNVQTIPIEYNSKRILTSKQLAAGYGTSTAVISNNFNNNIENYIIGEHYYTLQDDAKMEFLNRHKIYDGSKNVKNLYLWTEKGALLHAKSLNTPQAWQVYAHLIDHYFQSKAIPAPVPPKPETMIAPTEMQMIRLLASNLLMLEQKLAAIELRPPEPANNPQLERLINLLEALHQPVAETDMETTGRLIPMSEVTPISRKDARKNELSQKKLLTRPEAAEYLGIRLSTLYTMALQPGFPIIRIGQKRGRVFVNRELLDEWFKGEDCKG